MEDLKNVQKEIAKMRKILSDDAKYQNQVFLPGAKVTIDAKVYEKFLTLLNNSQRLFATIQQETAVIQQMISMIMPHYEKSSLEFMKVFKEAIDSGLTKTVEPQTTQEDGEVTTDN